MRHLVVLQHGLDGHDSDFDALRHELRAHPDDDEMIVWDTKCNHDKTHEGIDACTRRLWRDLRATIREHEGHPLRVSLVGHSFGGLVLRHCAVFLHLHQHSVSGIELCSYVSLASPHLGSRSLKGTGRAGARALYGRSGAELLLDAHATCALDVDLCDEAHCSALRAFRRRVTYSSVEGDWVVSFASGSLLTAEEQVALVPLAETAARPAGCCRSARDSWHREDARQPPPPEPPPAEPPSAASVSWFEPLEAKASRRHLRADASLISSSVVQPLPQEWRPRNGHVTAT